MTYTPVPMDTSAIDLPEEVEALIEVLAKDNHDVWAAQRISEGWTCGPKRDDTAKTHPDLAPFAGLPESEKDYDRRSVEQTLKAVLALGCSIVRE